MKRAMLLTLALAASGPLGATTYLLTFSGTYTISTLSWGDLFGMPVPAPFLYTITYDTALDTNDHVYLPGMTLPTGHPVAAPFYGYSASGILAMDVRLGTNTWTSADLGGAVLPGPVTADLWFNTDLDVATPTESWITFSDSEANLWIGVGALMGGGASYLPNRSDIESHYTGGMYIADDMVIQRTALSPVPDTGSSALLCALGILLFGTAAGMLSAEAARPEARQRSLS